MAITSKNTSNPPPIGFDIVPHYHKLLKNDPTLTPPIAAIESLISLLSASPITTVSETLNLISHASAILVKSQRNPIPVGAGIDLFQRYLITSFQNNPVPSQSPGSSSSSDFTLLRNHIISNSKVFVSRAKSAKTKIASYGLPLIRDESVVVTYGSSRVVGSLLTRAVDAGRWFRVVQVMPSSTTEAVTGKRIATQVSDLRKAGIEVATVPLAALSFALNSLSSSSTVTGSSSTNTMVILGTSAILENGAAVSEMGCYLVAQVAKMHGIPLYIAVESYKFARHFPLGYGARDLEKMGAKQDVLRFAAAFDFTTAATSTTTGTGTTTASGGDDQEHGDDDSGEGGTDTPPEEDEQAVDITPPKLISGLITENGIMTPNAVTEELIKLWF